MRHSTTSERFRIQLTQNVKALRLEAESWQRGGVLMV